MTAGMILMVKCEARAPVTKGKAAPPAAPTLKVIRENKHEKEALHLIDSVCTYDEMNPMAPVTSE